MFLKLFYPGLALLALASGAQAQTGHEHMQHTQPVSADASAPGPAATLPMAGALGSYPMSREASGTSWQPENTPTEGLHSMAGNWMVMWHGSLNLVYDHQGGLRGGDKAF